MSQKRTSSAGMIVKRHLPTRSQGRYELDLNGTQHGYHNAKGLNGEKQKHAWGPRTKIPRQPLHATLQLPVPVSPNDLMRLGHISAKKPSCLINMKKKQHGWLLTGFESFSKHCRGDKAAGVAWHWGPSIG